LFRSGWKNFTLMYGGRYVYRQIWNQAQSYIPYLEEAEKGHYENNELVCDGVLRERYEQRQPVPRIRVISTVSSSRDFGAPLMPTI
jgi:hypothetical protein